MIKWEATKEEIQTIGNIVDRYMEFHHSLGIPKKLQRPRMDLLMDVEACHCNGCKLNLKGLLEAKDFDFIHDLVGIQEHIDRRTGQLQDYFLPRYSVTS